MDGTYLCKSPFSLFCNHSSIALAIHHMLCQKKTTKLKLTSERRNKTRLTGDIRAEKRASLEFRFISILPPPSLLLSFNYSFGKKWEVFSQQTTANLLHVRTNQLYLTRAIKYQKEQAEDRNNRREEDSRQTERERETEEKRLTHPCARCSRHISR